MKKCPDLLGKYEILQLSLSINMRFTENSHFKQKKNQLFHYIGQYILYKLETLL